MTADTSDGLSLRAYLRVVSNWKWLVLSVTLVVLITGIAYTWTRTPLYSASADMLYVRPVDIQDPLGQASFDTTAQQAEIEAVPVVLVSTEVRNSAEAQMDLAPSADYSVQAILTLQAEGGYSNVVTITAVSPDPEVAATAANAYAKAFIEWGRDNARQQISDAIDVVQARLGEMAGSVGTNSEEYQSLQGSLLELELLQASIGGSFKVITAASPPSEPFSPNKTRGALLALVAGLVLGLGLAFLLEQFDTRVRSESMVAESLGLATVGRIPPLTRKDRDTSPIKIALDPTGLAAESYRMLRSNLDLAAVGEDVRVLLVSSTVQGEGKSVISCNLAVSMALAGKRVILVDADLRRPRVHQYLGLQNTRGVSTAIARSDNVSDVLVDVSLRPSPMVNGAINLASGVYSRGIARVGASALPLGSDEPGGGERWLSTEGSGDGALLRVLPSGPPPPNPGEMVASHRFGDLVRTLADDCDVVLLDAPAMLAVGDTAGLAPWADALVYVADPSKLRRPQLERAREQLSQLPIRKLGMILVSADHAHGYYTDRRATR